MTCDLMHPMGLRHSVANPIPQVHLVQSSEQLLAKLHLARRSKVLFTEAPAQMVLLAPEIVSV